MVRAHAPPCERPTVRVLLDALTECSITDHQAANGHPVEKLGRQSRRGKELATPLHMLMAQDWSPL